MITGKRGIGTLFFTVLFILLSFVMQGCAQTEKNGTELTEYVRETTGIKTEDLCAEVFGEIRQGDGEATSANICLKLERGGLEKIKNRIEETGAYHVEESDSFPFTTDNNPIGQKFMDETASVEAEYWFMCNGFNGAKTRTVFVYLTMDSSGSEFLYMFD